MASQRFCLRWNNHQSNLLSVFDQLLHAETFTDVTLAVEGQYLKAHKMVLSACSPYFQVLFTNTPDDKHPILILKDITLADMKSLLDFMYRGEVSVDQERLTAFLRVAESLRIKGLTEVNEDKQPKVASTNTSASETPSSKTGSSSAATAAASANSKSSSSAVTNASNAPPELHRIQPYVMQQQRKAQGMMLTNPLLGSALTQPKRKRGRPRKLSGSSVEGADAADFEEFEANMAQTTDMLEVKLGADGYSDNSDRDGDDSDNDAMDTSSQHNHRRRTAPRDSSNKDHHTDSQKDNNEQSASEKITPANYATYLKYGLLIPKPDTRTSGSASVEEQQMHQQQQPHHHHQHTQQQQPQHELQLRETDSEETSLDIQLSKQSSDHQKQQMSPPMIRVNPNTQTRNQSRLANALQHNQTDSTTENNNNSATSEPTTNSTELVPTSVSNAFARSIVSSYLSNQQQQQQQQQQHQQQHQQQQMLALQLQRAAPPPTQPKSDTPTSQTNTANLTAINTPTTRHSSSRNNHNNNNNHSTDLTQTSPADSTPTTPSTPTNKPPQRRRVRRKVNSPLDDPAEQLTEMSVRGLDLFRYAKICEGIYQCTECLKENIQKTFKNKYSFQRHAFLYHEGSQRKVFPCPVCNREFSRPDKMKNHMKTTHEGYVPREAAYPLNFLSVGSGDLAMSLGRFPKLSKAKLLKMEKLEALMMGPHFGSTDATSNKKANDDAIGSEGLQLGHRMVDMDEIDDDMDMDLADLPTDAPAEASTPPPLLSSMQSKIDDVVQRIQMAQMEVKSTRVATSPIRVVDTIKLEETEIV